MYVCMNDMYVFMYVYSLSATDHRREGVGVVQLSEPTSVPLRDAADLVTWTEHTCQVLAESVADAMQRPIELECPGLWAPFPILGCPLSGLSAASLDSDFCANFLPCCT